ncbi:rod shape-determining protein [Candidatus Roizmanbacteria bacterium]|nr:rod shape-determining protein [Candidatus Roizmanbacteria bacterium]
MLLDPILGIFSYDLAIDLGTANTLVGVLGKGIVIREPSVVARHRKTKKVLAVGSEAKKMMGKTPGLIEAFRPLRHGVISDFDAAYAMLKYYIQEVHQRPGGNIFHYKNWFSKLPRPRVVIGIPAGVTEVERRAVWEAALEAGAREAYLIEEPMAAALGVGLPVETSTGSMILDIGGGTSELAVISLGGIVVNRSIRLAGDEMDEAIVKHVRLRHSLLIGSMTAEDVKITVGSAYPIGKETSTVIRGRSLESGLPKSIKVTSTEVREAISTVTNQIVEHLKDLIEEIPPELVGDIMEHGIHLAGGGSRLAGLDKMIAEQVKMPVVQSKDPETAVVRGAGKVLKNAELLNKVKVTGGLQ